ncbi:MAG: FecR domain-containing protein, partial [Pseudomonadota bacterium]
SDGTRKLLEQGAPVASGDIIQTNARGEAQLLFPDQTRIVVGPGSTLVLERTLFNSRNKAQRFVINAVGGTYRFISGESRKSRYQIKTPTATMGIRGTAFDFTVTDEETTVLMYEGIVNLCARDRHCARLSETCSSVIIDVEELFSQPGTDREHLQLLTERFPYRDGQIRLRADFRTRMTNNQCEDRVDTADLPSGPPPAQAPSAPGSGNDDEGDGDGNP